MEDIIIYLIFIAFALLSRFLTKKKENQAPPQEPNAPREQVERQRPQRQPSFEDLLREFTGEGTVQEAEKKEPQPVSPYQSYEDEQYEVENYEERYARDEEAREVYQRSVNQAKDLRTMDEIVDYNTVKTKLKQFDSYEQKEQETFADKLRNQLRNPEEIKKAIIYSEIFNRRY